MQYVGVTAPRIDAVAKVTGKATYPGDLDMPDQVYMKILFANRPHAIIRKIDTTLAESLPGVIAVFTAKDVPVNEYGLMTGDQPVLCGPGSTIEYADRVRFIGDQVSLVVAETEEIASKARDAIQVEFEDLPIVSDIETALRPDAFLVHPELGSNVFVQYRIRKGDIDRGFREADVIIEGDYSTPAQEHAYLQPEAGLSYIDDEGRVTVVVAGQWTHEDQEQIAHALNLPLEKIRVIYPAIGGAFGGREDMSVQIVLALATWRLSQRGINRPIKIIWSREESIIGHHKRHPFHIHTRWGAKRDGKLTAVEVNVVSDGGAYIYTSAKVLGNATLMCTGPYDIPNVKVDSCSVYTNNIPNGAFRGFGGPQGAFAAECQMNKLAEALRIDPVEIRMRNILHEDSLLSVGTPLPRGVTIDKVIAECARKAGWTETDAGWVKPKYPITVNGSPEKRRGLGFACSYKNVGFSFGAPEQSWATIEIHGDSEIDEVILHHAGADVGQGAHTVFAQMAAEATGVPIEKVKLIVSDTAFTKTSGSASASRMTFMAGNSIRGAAAQALEKWQNEERPAVATYQYRPPKTTPLDPQTGKSEPNFAYGYVAEAVEVEVDVETGQTKILKVTCADDVGKAINPNLVKGQVEGAVVQASGYTMMENFVQRNGQTLTRYLSTYLIPTILDIPGEVDSLILEYPDPIGPWGARGMGEMPFLPLPGAVCAAVNHATDIWFNDFPLTSERVLNGINGLG
jgi:CO/xanthine dehydrogenase Mo-binding subunit